MTPAQPEHLRRLLLFEGLEPSRLEWCTQFFDVASFDAGMRVTEPDRCHSFVAVVDGEVEVLVDLEPIAMLRPGGFWLDDGTHLADRHHVAIATCPVTVLRMTTWDYVALTAAVGIVESRIHHVMRSRAGLSPWGDDPLRAG